MNLSKELFILFAYRTISIKEICKTIKLNRYEVTKFLKSNNVKNQIFGEWNKFKFKLENCEARIKFLYLNEKKTTHQIAKIFKVSQPTISNILKREKVKIRNRSDCRHKNSKYLSHSGYIIVAPRGKDKRLAKGKKQIPEHRLIVARHLKRPLKKHEVVHHKNGIRTDNRLENLELLSTSHCMGQKIVDKIKWAKSILELYEDDLKNRRIV